MFNMKGFVFALILIDFKASRTLRESVEICTFLFEVDRAISKMRSKAMHSLVYTEVLELMVFLTCRRPVYL